MLHLFDQVVVIIQTFSWKDAVQLMIKIRMD